MKETLFSIVLVIRKPIQLYMTIINTTRPDCTRLKFRVDLVVNQSEFVKIELVSARGQETRVERINIQYGFISKYSKRCKIQDITKLNIEANILN